MVLANESPLKQAFDRFDVEHMDWSAEQYKQYALSVPISVTNSLLIKDWQWRKDHHQNIVASIEGDQGAGKSMPFFYASLLAGKIFGVPFSANSIYFQVSDLNDAISKAIPCQTFMKDEHKHKKAGMMAYLNDEILSDYEDELRINQNNLFYCSVELQDHSHFFCFEAKNTEWDKTGKVPLAFISVLKTKRYTDRKELVWRGLVKFPMPSKEHLAEYDKRKRENIVNLKAGFSTTLDPVREFGEKIFTKRFKELYRETKDGKNIPIQAEQMTLLIDEEIGTSKFTNAGYRLLQAIIRDKIEKHFKQENAIIDEFKRKEKEEKEKEFQEKKEKEKAERAVIREEKNRIALAKLEEQRKYRELKEKLLNENLKYKKGA